MKLKPIETAPKDGTLITLYDATWYTGPYDTSSKYKMGKWNTKWTGEDDWSLENLSGSAGRRGYYPTHWCELPEAPSE